MDDRIVKIEKVSNKENLYKIVPLASERDISLVPALLSEFRQTIKNGGKNFIFDLSRFDDLPPSFIVLLFEMTATARRLGGSVILKNISKGALEAFESFHPFSYLSYDESTASDHGPAEISKIPENTTKRSAVFEKQIDIPSKISALYLACDFVTELAQEYGFEKNQISKLKIAVYEACLNVIEHAYHSDPANKVYVNVTADSEKFVIEIIDHGEGFLFYDNYKYDISAAAETRKKGGMGLHIIRHAVDELNYDQDPVEGNKLQMIKYRKY